MDRIPVIEQEQADVVERIVVGSEQAKKKAAKSILNYAGILVSVFLVFVVVVVMTTEIKFTSFMDVAELGLEFFVLLFCAYLVYISCSNSGQRNGLSSTIYAAACDDYEMLKKQIIDNKWQVHLAAFCKRFVEDELKATRSSIVEEVGINFEEYRDKYIGKDRRALEEVQDLSEKQRDAIVRANTTSPIKLTPEMIFKRGRGSRDRSPLGVSPQTKRAIGYVSRFLQIALSSLLMGVIVLEVVSDPNWATFAAVMLKVVSVVVQGVFGYINGYENIVIDTVNYMYDQIDLMNQAIQYIEANNME